jgi:hypothetical protein
VAASVGTSKADRARSMARPDLERRQGSGERVVYMTDGQRVQLCKPGLLPTGSGRWTWRSSRVRAWLTPICQHGPWHKSRWGVSVIDVTLVSSRDVNMEFK